jgi:serine/threonine protein phosphatase 1
MKVPLLSKGSLPLNWKACHSSAVVCFGDIHGHRAAAETAVTLAEELGFRSVFLGDYVDRGPDSAGVLKVLMEAARRHPDWVFLLGNHDLMLMNILQGLRHAEGYDSRTFEETLPTIAPEERASILQWLQALPAFFRSGSCLFVHGGFTDSAVPVEEVPTEELVWTYGIPESWQGDTVVRGHSLVEQVERKYRDININTRCGFGGYLTGLLVNAEEGYPLHMWQIGEDGSLVFGPILSETS